MADPAKNTDKTKQGDKESRQKRREFAKNVAIYGSAAVVAIAAAPLALSAAGFTSGGIAAGSVAAKIMSILGPNSVIVQVLQSAGAAGFGPAGNTLIGVSSAGVVRSARSKMANAAKMKKEKKGGKAAG